MNENFHIIIAGDQHQAKSFRITKQQGLIGLTAFLLISALIIGASIFSISVYATNVILHARVKIADKKVREVHSTNIGLKKKLAATEHTYNQQITQLQLQSSKKIKELEKINTDQLIAFKEDKNLLLSTAVSELNTRSEFIENVIKDIGIKVKDIDTNSSEDHTGGPFVAVESSKYDQLIFKADKYLQAIKNLPLGRPTPGPVTSWFGPRLDPFNHRKAFHEGIDFRGRIGTPVHATADGRVSFVGTVRGYGKMIKIDHGNGYTTKFGHLHAFKVKKGDYVSRGQVIGQIGNTGRSTGSHLHYEIGYKGKPINPAKFMKVANLTCKFNQ